MKQFKWPCPQCVNLYCTWSYYFCRPTLIHHFFLHILLFFNKNEHFVPPVKFCPFFESYINIFFTVIFHPLLFYHTMLCPPQRLDSDTFLDSVQNNFPKITVCVSVRLSVCLSITSWRHIENCCWEYKRVRRSEIVASCI